MDCYASRSSRAQLPARWLDPPSGLESMLTPEPEPEPLVTLGLEQLQATAGAVGFGGSYCPARHHADGISEYGDAGLQCGEILPFVQR